MPEDSEEEAIVEEHMAAYREIAHLVKIEADKYTYVSNATIRHTLSQLPQAILKMPCREVIDKMTTDDDFEKSYNHEFRIFDEFNLLGLNKPSEPAEVASNLPQMSQDHARVN